MKAISHYDKNKQKSEPDLFCCTPSKDTNASEKQYRYTSWLFSDIFKADSMKLISRNGANILSIT